jgi:hypothetical protein
VQCWRGGVPRRVDLASTATVDPFEIEGSVIRRVAIRYTTVLYSKIAPPYGKYHADTITSATWTPWKMSPGCCLPHFECLDRPLRQAAAVGSPVFGTCPVAPSEWAWTGATGP